MTLATGMLAGCSSKEKRAGEVGPAVSGVETEVAHVEAAPMFYQAVGTVRSAHAAVLAAQLAGTVREVRVNPGDRVQRGQLLAVLDDRGARAQVQGAEAGVQEALHGEAEVESALQAATADRKFAEATFNRYKSLLAKNSLSRQEFDGAEARYQAALANERAMQARKQETRSKQAQARSQQDSAQTVLSYARVVAPFAGVVTAKLVDAGSVVMPGAPLVTVEDAGQYRLEASLPEEYLANVKTGARVEVTVGAKQLSGTVAEIVPAADAASHTFLVKVDLPADGDCRSGEYGQADFPVGAVPRLAVPSAAVVEHGELQGVFVLSAAGTVEYRLVKAGKTFGTRIEILSGLAAGEKVAVSKTDQLRDGARVEGL
jgi:RND family efflux transporter MFP subunit